MHKMNSMNHERYVGIYAHSKRQCPDAEALFIKDFPILKFRTKFELDKNLKSIKMNNSLFTQIVGLLLI